MSAFDLYLAIYDDKGLDYLRKHLPEVQRLENLNELQDLKLVDKKSDGGILTLDYKARAPSLFPAVRQRLIDQGVVKRHNVLCTFRRYADTSLEDYRLILGFYGDALQIHLALTK
jgi:hypothetical protein